MLQAAAKLVTNSHQQFGGDVVVAAHLGDCCSRETGEQVEVYFGHVFADVEFPQGFECDGVIRPVLLQ